MDEDRMVGRRRNKRPRYGRAVLMGLTGLVVAVATTTSTGLTTSDQSASSEAKVAQTLLLSSDAVNGLEVAGATVTRPGQTSAPTTAPTPALTPTTLTPTTVTPTTVPTTAAPTTTVTTTAAPAVANHVALGNAALSRISYPWQSRLSGWSIVFSPGREGAYGYTYTDRQVIEIFVRDGQSETLLSHVIAHELGHAVDVTLNTSAERDQWVAARGLGGSPWWPGNGANDFSTGAGDFAESFAAWQVGPGNFRSNLGSAPNAEQLALIAQLAG